MGKGTIIGLGAAAVAAGGIILGTMGDSNGPQGADGGVKNAIIAATNIEEHEARPRAYRAPNGKHIRVVGVEPEEEQPSVTDSELGRVVEVPAVPGDAICPVVVHADAKIVDGKKWPDIDGIDWGMRPVPLGHSKRGDNYVWHSYVEGQAACEAAVSHPNYLGSSMAELLALPDEMKARCLKVNGMCNIEGQITTCSVPWGDPRSSANSPIRFPHRLSGRPDINMVHTDDRGTPEDRIPEPDGGWGAEIPEPQEVDGGKPDAEVAEIP